LLGMSIRCRRQLLDVAQHGIQLLTARRALERSGLASDQPAVVQKAHGLWLDVHLPLQSPQEVVQERKQADEGEPYKLNFFGWWMQNSLLLFVGESMPDLNFTLPLQSLIQRNDMTQHSRAIDLRRDGH